MQYHTRDDIMHGERLGPVFDIEIKIYYRINDLNYMFSCKAVAKYLKRTQKEDTQK